MKTKEKFKPPVKIVPLNIKIYKEGVCFICGEETESDRYAHHQCCIAYEHHKEFQQDKENQRCEQKK